MAHLSTGDLLRAEIAAKTALGTQVEDLINRGQLVEAKTMAGIVSSGLSKYLDNSVRYWAFVND
jgi:adenylate kinase